MRSNIVHPNIIKNCIGKLIEVFCSPYSKKKLTEQYYKLISGYDYQNARYVMNACGHYGAQWDFYLKRYYKDYMKLPPEDEREFWLNFSLDIDERDYAMVEGALKK